MPHPRHPVTAEDEPLNVTQVEGDLRTRARMGIRPLDLMTISSEQTVEESPTFFFLRRVYLGVRDHGVSLLDTGS